MKLGIGSYTFTWAIGVPGHPPPRPLTALDLIHKAQDLGVRVVQFCDNLPLAALAARELDTLAEAAHAGGIDIEIGTRGLGPGNLMTCLDLATRFQAAFVRLVLDSKEHQPSSDEAIAALHPLIPRFAERGVKLAIENHDRFNAVTLVGIVEALGSGHVGICLDTVNSFGALEGPEVVVETLAPYTLNLHVKDFTIQRVSSQMGFVIEGRPAGQGRLDLPWLLGRVAAGGRRLTAVLELWTPFGPTLKETMAREAAWAEESVGHLRQLIRD